MAEDETQHERTTDTEESADVSGSDATDTVTTDERTESSASVGDSTSSDLGLDEGADLDRSAETFLDLESDLAEADGDELPDDLGYGLVVDAERVDVSAVPSDYPWTVTTGSALALTLEHGRTGRTVTAYFAWPPEEGDRLDRLLAVAGIDAEAFAELHGTQILLTVEDRQVVPFVPPAPPRGSTDGKYAVLGGLGFNLLTLAGVALGVGVVSSLWFLLVFLLVNLLVIPGGTALDARHLRSHTDWDQGPAFWGLLSAMPFANVLVSVLYLRSRTATRPIVK